MFLKQIKKSLLAVTFSFLVTSIVHAENVWQPFGPVDFEHDVQPFAQAELSEFGVRDKTNEGFTFSYSRMITGVGTPTRRPVGAPGVILVTTPDGISTVAQTNTLSTSTRNFSFGWGNRFDMGYVDDRHGWLLTVENLNSAQEFSASSASVNFTNPAGAIAGLTLLSGFIDLNGDGIDDDVDGDTVFGRHGDGTVGNPLSSLAASDLGDTVIFPTTFDTITVQNFTDTNNVELMKMYRFKQLHNNTTVEFLYGVRWTEINDRFNVNATGGFSNSTFTVVTPPPAVLTTNWLTAVENQMVGPQVGIRWNNRRGRWNFVFDGRFFAAANFQNVRQTGHLAAGLPAGTTNVNAPVAMGNREFENFAHFVEFAPAASIRVESTYALTKAIELQVGWSAQYADGIGRGSSMTTYRLPTMAINSSANREAYFSHGLSFGFVINR